MSDTESLGALLTRLREAAGLKIPEVIAKLGAPRSTVYWWHGPKSRPENPDLQRLLDLYDASPADRLRAWELRSRPASDPSASGLVEEASSA